MSRLKLTFSALAACAGFALIACAQDGALLGADGSGTTDPDAGGAIGEAGGGATSDRATPPPPPPPGDSGRGGDPVPDADPPPPDDSGPPDAGPPPDAAPLPNGDCNTSNSFLSFVYGAEYATAAFQGKLKLCLPGAGGCSATQCCYTGTPLAGCVSR